MRIAILTVVTLVLGAGALQAQSPSQPSRESQRSKDQINDTLADCLKLWEPATHMTRQDWARTCKRVQTRLDNVRVEDVDALGKGSGRQSPRTSRQ